MKKLPMLAAIVAAYPAVSFVTGQLVVAKMNREMVQMQALIPAIKVIKDEQHTGLFHSSRVTTVDLVSAFNPSKCAPPAGGDKDTGESPDVAAVAPKAEPAKPILFTVKQIITHGPVPGFGLPAAAKVRIELLINDRPISERLGAELTGEMPAFVARYGFAGGTDVSWSAGKGAVVFKDDHGKPLVGLAWPTFAIKGSSNAANTHFTYDGKLPELAAAMTDESGKQLRVVLKDLSLTADRERPFADQWFVYTGIDQLHFASLDVEMDGKPLAQLLDAKAEGKSVMEKGLMDSRALMSLATLKAGGEIIGPIRYDFSMLHLDPVALGQLMNAIMQNSNGACPTPAQSQKLLADMKGALPALLKSNPEIQINRLSVGYGSEEALITATMHLPGVTAADLEQPAALVAKLEVVATLSLPEKLINSLAVKAADQQIKKAMERQAAGALPTAEQLAQAKSMAEDLVQQQVGRAITNNWLLRQDKNLVGKFEFHQGHALLNGLPFKGRGGGE